MPVKKLRDFLDEKGIKYVIISHSAAYTAQEIAAAAHIPGKNVAKTIVVKLDDRMAMAVLPATYKADLGLLKKAVGASKAELASEGEFKGLFPDCEIGAMPPVGNLYEMEVIVSESLAEDEEIAFNACSHRELIKMAYKDFEKIVQPKLAKFSVKRS